MSPGMDAETSCSSIVSMHVNHCQYLVGVRRYADSMVTCVCIATTSTSSCAFMCVEFENHTSYLFGSLATL